MSGAAVVADYERDLASQTRSGPHHIDEQRRELNRTVFHALQALVPFDDIHKKSDCDLIYRFLIAKKWDANEAIKALKEYAQFRIDNRLNEILWEENAPEIRSVLACDYSGFDNEGHPIFFDRPDPKGLSVLLSKFSRDELMRTHYRMMEQGRRLCKMYGTDRVSCILDLSLLSMSIIANPAAIGFLKGMAHVDQSMYPENMRFMLICNGGWTFSSLYKILKPLLDPRVQQKINFIGTGANTKIDLEKFVTMDVVPSSLGGSSTGKPLLQYSDLVSLPVATPPQVLQDRSTGTNCADLLFSSPTGEGPSQLPVPDAADDAEALL